MNFSASVDSLRQWRNSGFRHTGADAVECVPPPPESRHVGLTPTAQHSDLRLRNLRHWQLAHAADFIKLTFVVVSHTIFLVRLFLLHLAYCAPGQLLPSAALVMPLHDENHCWGVLCVRNPVLTEVTVCQRNNIGPGFTVNPNLLTL